MNVELEGRILSQTDTAIRSRRFRKKHPEHMIKHAPMKKKKRRLKKAIALLEKHVLRTEFKNRRDEFIREYVDCSDVRSAKNKWFLGYF